MKVHIGPVLMICAGLCFALMLANVKLVRAELSTLEVICWRGVVATPLALLWVRGRSLRIRNHALMAVRVGFGLGAMSCYYTAARLMPLADLSLVTRLQPIVIALLAPMVLGAQERSGGRLWLILALGTLGCGILLAPQAALGTAGGLWWAIGALLCGGVAHVALRGLGPTEDSRVVVFWTQAAITAAAFLLLLATGTPQRPPMHLTGPLLAIGAFAAAGQLLMTRAYALDRASVIAGASNVFPVWAFLLDLILFSTLPSRAALIGGPLILVASFGLIFSRSSSEPDA